MQTVLEKAMAAMEFLKTLTKDKLDELRQPLAWRQYTELNYVFLMNELF